MRVIEVSKIHNLYDPFTDRGIKNVKIAQLSNSNSTPPEIDKKIVIPKQEVLQFKNERKKLTKAKSLGKMVHVVIEVEGEGRKGGVYIAKITGTDPKYGFKREFLPTKNLYEKNTSYKTFDGTLPMGTIIETGEGGSWKNRYRFFGIVAGSKKSKEGYVAYPRAVYGGADANATSIKNKLKFMNILEQREKLGISNSSSDNK